MIFPKRVHFLPSAVRLQRGSKQGCSDVLDAVHQLVFSALDVLTSGRIDDIVDAEYINSLEWYRTLHEILSGESDEDGIQARGEGHLHFPHGIARRTYTAEDAQFQKSLSRLVMNPCVLHGFHQPMFSL